MSHLPKNLPSADFWSRLSKNDLFIALVGAVVAAALAFYFGLRAQRKNVREQHKLKMYERLWEGRDAVVAANIELATLVRGFDTTWVIIFSLETSKKIMKGIKEPEEYDRQIDEKWSQYTQDVAYAGTKLIEEFGKLRSMVEQTHFMYPQLKKPFELLCGEQQKLWDMHQALTSYLFGGVDALLVSGQSERKEIQAAIDKNGLLEQSMDLTAYLVDFFNLMQEALVSNIFNVKIEERRPEVGKVLTLKGWKEVKAAKAP